MYSLFNYEWKNVIAMHCNNVIVCMLNVFRNMMYFNIIINLIMKAIYTCDAPFENISGTITMLLMSFTI